MDAQAEYLTDFAFRANLAVEDFTDELVEMDDALVAVEAALLQVAGSMGALGEKSLRPIVDEIKFGVYTAQARAIRRLDRRKRGLVNHMGAVAGLVAQARNFVREVKDEASKAVDKY